MTAHNQTIEVEMPLNIVFLVNKTRKPNQPLNERYIELIKEGIETQEAEKQLAELVKEGKVNG